MFVNFVAGMLTTSLSFASILNYMAAEPEQLRKDASALSKKFKDAGQDDLAALLDVDAQGFGAKAKIARNRGVLTFASAAIEKANVAPLSPYEQVQTLLGLTPEQVAKHPLEVTEDTKAYVGQLVNRDPNGKVIPVFETLKGVEYIYTAEGKRIPRWSLEIGGKGKTTDELIEAIEDSGMKVSDWAKDIMRTPKFTEALKAAPKTVDLVMLDVGDLRYSRGGTTTQIFDQGNELGLDKCDPRVGPYQRMADQDQKMNDWYWIAMDPITDSNGDPRVFRLSRVVDGLWLRSGWAYPDGRWGPLSEFVFSLRK